MKTRDGRKAYIALKDQFLGTDSITNLSASAENTLCKLTYHGEQRSFNFDKYIEISMNQHTILDDLETNRALRYKLRMMGVPITGPSYFYGDNMSVINNAQRSESVLRKKSNSICYHAVREAVAFVRELAKR